MDDSIIYDLLSLKLHKYRKKLENIDNIFAKWVKESREELENSLSKEQLTLVDKHIHNLVLKEEEIELLYQINLLNYGIKIGMQLQEAFEKFSEDFNPPMV